jgi:hypothetical protein
MHVAYRVRSFFKNADLARIVQLQLAQSLAKLTNLLPAANNLTAPYFHTPRAAANHFLSGVCEKSREHNKAGDLAQDLSTSHTSVSKVSQYAASQQPRTALVLVPAGCSCSSFVPAGSNVL